jgi:hypothetical protein
MELPGSVAFFATISGSPPRDRATPCNASTDRHHQNDIAFFQRTGTVRFIDRDRQ